jgi:hypothetical protein
LLFFLCLSFKEWGRTKRINCFIAPDNCSLIKICVPWLIFIANVYGRVCLALLGVALPFFYDEHDYLDSFNLLNRQLRFSWRRRRRYSLFALKLKLSLEMANPSRVLSMLEKAKMVCWFEVRRNTYLSMLFYA